MFTMQLKCIIKLRANGLENVEQLERAGQLDLDRSTKLKWTFELQLPDRLSATSTEEMQGGAGKVVSFDALTGKFTGYGSPEESQ